MKKSPKISEILNGLEDIFNPPMNYEGSFVIPLEIFYDNSKIKNGKNLVEEFFENMYFNPIKNAFHGIKMTQNPTLFLESDISENGYGRTLKGSLILLATDLIYQITGNDFHPSDDSTELITQVKDYSRWYRKELSAIQHHEMNEEREKLLKDLEASYQNNERIRAKYYASTQLPLSFAKFLERKKEYMVSLSFGIKNIAPLFSKSIDLSKLAECLNLEKFYLTLMKYLIEITKIYIDKTGHVHNSLVQVATYINIVNDIRQKEKYDLEITYTFPNRKKIKYSIDDLINEYNEIRLKNPDFRIIEFDPDPDTDLRDYNNALELMHQIDDLIRSKELKASWNFIRNGKLDDKNDVKSDHQSPVKPPKYENKAKKKNYKKSREELIQDAVERLTYLDSTRYLYKIHGKNNFDGYVGYIYENGSVIFEKFYCSQNSLKPALENATYVMSLSNFVEMSRKTKTEIISYIKSGATELRRIYHTSTWYTRIEQVINSKTYNQETIDRIERLINEDQLQKRITKGE